MVPENFKRAINYGWAGAVGMGNWVAYVLASMYWLSAEVGIGSDICEAFGYGYWIVDNLRILVDFMPKTDGNGEDSSSSMFDLSKLASGAALDEAALAALAGFAQAQTAAEEEQKDEIQAAIDAGEDPNASAEADASAEGEVSTEAKE